MQHQSLEVRQQPDCYRDTETVLTSSINKRNIIVSQMAEFKEEY